MNARTSTMMVLVIAATARGNVVGDIARVGYPSVGGASEGSDVIRPDSWVPVVVDLQLEGQASFDGWIRLSQPDKDGDYCYDLQKIQLMAEAGPRRYTLYAVANPGSTRDRAFAVEVLDGENRRVEVSSRGSKSWTLTPSQAPEMLAANFFLVLSVSSRTVGRVADLQGVELADHFAKTVRIAHVAPNDLPNQWIGLDVVDAVVWDDADPTEMSAAQLEALLEWTRQGGLLVVAAGRSADTVAQTAALSSVLPVEVGAVEQVSELPKIRRNFLGLDADKGESYTTPISVVKCKPRRGATDVLTEGAGEEARPMIARQRLGRGRVVFVAASIRELFSDGGAVEKFFRRVLELRGPPDLQGSDDIRLFGEVDRWVGYSQAGALYLGLAMLFAAAYVLGGAVGTWQFLSQRGWRRHSWSAFALAAIAANVLSVIGVQAVRGGVGKRLIQLSVVDAEARQSAAHATTYFGLKTSLFGEMDVWAAPNYPQELEPSPTTCFLKPLPSSSAFGTDRHYADPGRYQLAPSLAELSHVPIRGTVKEFEGRWSGSMQGRLSGQVHVQTGPGGGQDRRITADSTIVNELGVDIDRGYLFYTAKDAFLPQNTLDVRRADSIYVFPVPAIASGGTFAAGDSFYKDVAGNELELDQWSKGRTLEDYLDSWCGTFRTINLSQLRGDKRAADLESRQIALLMMSFLSEYSARQDGGNSLGGQFVPNPVADGFRHLDISSMLDREHAVFIGFSKSAGPVQLCARSGNGDFEAVRPSQAMTMFRILIPLGSGG